MPLSPRSDARQPAAGVAGDRGRAPKPFLKEVIREVLESGLNPPVVLSDDKDEGVGGANFGSQRLHFRRCSALGIFLVHSIKDWKPDVLRVDELDGLASCEKAGHDE